jgi:hypothetical protein
MYNAYAHPSSFNHECLIELGIFSRIGVPVYCHDRRDRAKLNQHVRAPDVSRMEDQLHTFEGRVYRWSHEPVGVGDEPNDHAISFECHASYIT